MYVEINKNMDTSSPTDFPKTRAAVKWIVIILAPVMMVFVLVYGAVKTIKEHRNGR